ncbi:MAG: fatty acid desaturase [Chitinophagaceae bacterium]|nr:fatty acid desaturase [Chitinophagaceae bacterium]
MRLFNDARLKSIQWKDLTHLSQLEMIIENSITLPWLLISCLLAWYHYYLFALPFSFLFFLTGLRQVHNGFHHTLGTSRFLTHVTLLTNSVLMLTAMHAVRYNHLRHHKYCLQESDVEGSWAHMPAWKAILYGPLFIIRQHSAALHSKERLFIWLELTAITAFIIIAFVLPVSFLRYHVLAMLTGELFSGFFAVWTVHHDCDEEMFARSLSRRWKNRLTYNMFYHLEHHLFPGVPTIKLPVLAARIRAALPDITFKEVF